MVADFPQFLLLGVLVLFVPLLMVCPNPPPRQCLGFDPFTGNELFEPDDGDEIESIDCVWRRADAAGAPECVEETEDIDAEPVSPPLDSDAAAASSAAPSGAANDSMLPPTRQFLLPTPASSSHAAMPPHQREHLLRAGALAAANAGGRHACACACPTVGAEQILSFILLRQPSPADPERWQILIHQMENLRNQMILLEFPDMELDPCEFSDVEAEAAANDAGRSTVGVEAIAGDEHHKRHKSRDDRNLDQGGDGGACG